MGLGFTYGPNGYRRAVLIYIDGGSGADWMDKKNPELLNAINRIYELRHITEAWDCMEHFETHTLHGAGWASLQRDYNYKSLNEFNQKSMLVLNHQDSCDAHRKVAQTIQDVLYGNYQPPPKPEKSREEKERSEFLRKKPALRLKLVIRDGYQCDACGKDKEGSLCVVKKDGSSSSLQVANLALRCRSCMIKARNKAKK
tara:strand:+ start:3635 stop:4231 length:597 start_codon:yes stop_codon:yes gene_type:complete